MSSSNSRPLQKKALLRPLQKKVKHNHHEQQGGGSDGSGGGGGDGLLWWYEPRQQIHNMFQDDSFMNKLDQLLNILRKYPELAKQKFPSPYLNKKFGMKGAKAHPLYSLIMGRAKLDVVSEVYKLFPNVLSTRFLVSEDDQQSNWSTTFLDACSERVDNDVLQFMITKYPGAAANRPIIIKDGVRVPNHSELLPLECLLCEDYARKGSVPSAKTVEMILDAYPDAIKFTGSRKDQEDQFRCFLERVLTAQNSVEVIALLSKRLRRPPKNHSRVRSLSLLDDLNYSDALNFVYPEAPVATALSPLLGGLETFEFAVEGMAIDEFEGFQVMLNCLARSNNLKTLKLILEPMFVGGDSETKWTAAMGSFLEKNSKLEELIVTGLFDCDEDDIKQGVAVKALSQARHCLPSGLKLLHIEGCEVQAEPLNEFLLEGRLPRQVRLEKMWVHEDWEQWNLFDTCQAPRTVRNLVLDRVHCSRKWMNWFLSLLPAMICLESLSVTKTDYEYFDEREEEMANDDDEDWQPKSVDATTAVAGLLKRDRIKCIRLDEVEFDLTPLATALGTTNARLSDFQTDAAVDKKGIEALEQVLEQGQNTTLAVVDLSSAKEDETKKVVHLARLNGIRGSHGVSNPSLPPTKLVKLLCRVSNQEHLNTEQKTSLYYDLLVKSAALWSLHLS